MWFIYFSFFLQYPLSHLSIEPLIYFLLQLAISCKVSKAPGWAKDKEGDDCKLAFAGLQKPSGESCSFEVMYTYKVTNLNSVDTVEYVKQLWTEFTTGKSLSKNEDPDDPRLDTQKRLVRQMATQQSRRINGCEDEDYWVAAYVDATRGGQGRRCDDREDYRFTTLGPGPPRPEPTRRPTPVPPSPTPRPPTAPTRCNWNVSDSLS